MTKRCNGCGVLMQIVDESKSGYVTDMKHDICQRCFKLKNYNVLINDGKSINNDELLNRINKCDAFVFFLVDFLTINKLVIDTYKSIKNKKMLVITKSDVIPKNIKKENLVKNIRSVYKIEDDIVLVSSSLKYNLSILEGVIKRNKKVLFAGFSNMGKSSLINALIGSDITTSGRFNTTQDFIKLSFDDITVFDVPGFIDNSLIKDNIKNVIRPRSYQLKAKYYLLIDDIKIYVDRDTNVTIYISNERNISVRKVNSEVMCKEEVIKGSDVWINNLGFIKFSNDTHININSDYEIRRSIIGGHYE